MKARATTKLYDRIKDQLTQDEIERIRLRRFKSEVQQCSIDDMAE
jgi:hypothetical protein